MNVAVIGCDGAGKTTFIEALATETGMTVVKGSSFEDSQCNQDELFEKHYERVQLDNTIFDRFFYCNEVYASLYNDYAMLSDEQRRALENEIRFNTVVIYIYASEDTLKNRINSRGDDYVKADRVPLILEKYNQALEKSQGIFIVKFNTDLVSTEDMVEITKQFIEPSNFKEIK